SRQATWQVEAARRGQFAAALECVFGGLSASDRAAHVRRLTSAEREGAISLDGLLVACSEEAILAAVWAQVQPGRVAGLWMSPTTSSEDDERLDALVAHAVAYLAKCDVAIAQSLLTTDACREARLLSRHGFEHLTDLLYLVSDAS